MPSLLMVSQLAWVIASWSTTVVMITALLKTGTPYAGRFAICWALAIASIIEGFLHTSDVLMRIIEAAKQLGVFTSMQCVEYIEASEVYFSNPEAQRRFGKVFTKYQVLEL